MHVTCKAWGAKAAALMALLMLSYATVVSTVMQVEMWPGRAASASGADPVQDPMPGMAMPAMPSAKSARTRGEGKPPASRSACPYCAAAAQLPVLGEVTLLRAPTAVTFAVFRLAASLGPRGPPPVQPRARGPPPLP